MIHRGRRLAFSLWGHLPFSWKLLLNKWVNDRFLVGLIGVVLNERRELLVLKHSYRPELPYGLPSGWLEKGESLADSFRREVREECGLDVSVGRVLHVEARERPTRIDIWLLCDLEGGQFRPSDEVTEGGFFPRDALPGIPREQREFLARNWAEISEDGGSASEAAPP